MYYIYKFKHFIFLKSHMNHIVHNNIKDTLYMYMC